MLFRSIATSDPKTGMKIEKSEKIRISSVVDIDVADRDEAMRIVNMMMALLNCKPADYGQTSMNAQYLEF